MKYSEIRESLKTGDLVLFSGKGLVSNLIKLGTRSQWSHVGVVINTGAGLQLWESTTLSDLADIHSGKSVRGVQTCFLSDRLATYEGKVGIRLLKNEMKREETQLLGAFREQVRGRPYEQNNIELAASALDLFDCFKSEDLSSLFCSELVAEALQQCGLLSDDMPSNEFTPADFARPIIPCDVLDSWEREIYEVQYEHYQRVSAKAS